MQVMLSSSDQFYGDFMSRQLATMRMSHMLQAWKVCSNAQWATHT